MSAVDKQIDELIRWVPIKAKPGGIKLDGFPASYRSLYERYTFSSFVLAGIEFFGNTDSGLEERKTYGESFHFAENIMIVGRPTDGSFDPICFDGRVSKQNREYPLVRIEHEQALQHSRVDIVEVVAKTFLVLVNGVNRTR